MGKMKFAIISGISVTLFIVALSAKGTGPATEAANGLIQGKSRTEVVNEVWRMATEGRLLKSEGWDKACLFFTDPAPFPGTNVIRVVSNGWGASSEGELKDNNADVEVIYLDMGKIDSSLRYTPSSSAQFMKMGISYHLVANPAYLMIMGPDGKTPIERRPVGYRVWQIKGSPGPPWTTVNTAIRYVLEIHEKTTDPAVKKNADRTLAELLKLH